MNSCNTNQKKNKSIKHRIAASVLLLLLSAALMILSAKAPAFAEWYSEYIYPLAVNSIGRISGMLPFSVSETGIYILLAVFFVTMIRMVIRTAKKDRTPDPAFSSWISCVLAAGVLAFLYTACCGITITGDPFLRRKGSLHIGTAQMN